MRISTVSRSALFAATVLLVGSCSDDPPTSPYPNGETKYKGSFITWNSVGTIEITIATSDPEPVAPSSGELTIPANAIVRIDSPPEIIQMNGTYKIYTGGGYQTCRVHLYGRNCSAEGFLGAGSLTGSYTGVNVDAKFVTSREGTGADTVTTFCGSNAMCAASPLRAGLVIQGTAVGGGVNSQTAGLIMVRGTYRADLDSVFQLIWDPPTGTPNPGRGTGRLHTDANGMWAEAKFVFTPGETCSWVGRACQ